MSEVAVPDSGPYWREVDGLLMPQPNARTPWAPNMLHGRLLSALAARAVEREHGDPELLCARLTIDLLRPAPLEPVQVQTAVAREGRRVLSIDISLSSKDKLIARASAVLLRRGPQPAAAPWNPAVWPAPPPSQLETVDSPEARFLPIEAREVTPGGFRAAGQKRLWLRELCPLVEGEEWTPLSRVAAIADLGNALVSCGEEPNNFINADVTLYLGRLPQGAWIGMESAWHVSADGVGAGACNLYNEAGRVGACTVGVLGSPEPIKL